VFVVLMALAAGIDRTFTASGDERNVLVIRKSAQVEGSSAVTKEEFQILRYLPGIENGMNGQPLVSPEVIVLLNIPRRNQGGTTNVTVRGVGPQAFELRRNSRSSRGGCFVRGCAK
jgi:putative ABC transport system permease protein